MMKAPRALVIGAGAIGGVIAAKLTRSGHRVVVLDANREHVSRMLSPGLVFDELGKRSTVAIDAVSDQRDLAGRFDVALVTVKAPYIEAALRPLVDRRLVDVFVSLGNGLVQDRIERITGPDRLVVGTVEWGATNVGPGHVSQTTVAPFVLGSPDATSGPAGQVAELLADVAEVRLTENIRGQVWSKLLVNSTFSGLGAVSGLVYGDVVADTAGREAALRLWSEGFAVAQASTTSLDEVLGVHPRDLASATSGELDRADKALDVVMSVAAATKASMLQDLERGVPTEVDVINGGVVATGQALGIATPMNSRIVEIVHECERGERRPGRENLDEVLGATSTE